MFSGFFPKIADFSDDQLAEAGAKFLDREEGEMRRIITSPAGQAVLAAIRDKASEPPPGLFHRCPECGFRQEIDLTRANSPGDNPT